MKPKPVKLTDINHRKAEEWGPLKMATDELDRFSLMRRQLQTREKGDVWDRKPQRHSKYQSYGQNNDNLSFYRTNYWKEIKRVIDWYGFLWGR